MIQITLGIGVGDLKKLEFDIWHENLLTCGEGEPGETIELRQPKLDDILINIEEPRASKNGKIFGGKKIKSGN